MPVLLPEELPDPADDRAEFKRRLESVFNDEIDTPKFTNAVMKAYLMDDLVEKAKCKAKMETANNKIDMYLTEWDNAKDKKDREVVVSSVRKD